jgi:two-component system cell cycle sensor histidine kinase/response regulator CckA
MNPVAERLTGWTLADARGKSLPEVLPLFDEDTRAQVEDPVVRALREGAPVTLPKRTVLHRRDATEIPIADTCAPIRGEGGSVQGGVLVFRDLTPQRTAEAVQASFQKQLLFADRMAAVGTLAAGAAHEINNPLTYVVANVDLAIEQIRVLGGGAASGPMKELEDLLLEAREGIGRVTKIVRGLKTFSRHPEEERTDVVDVPPVIDLSINMVSNEIRHRARLVKDYGPLPLVDADEARLGQVFVNLLVNAAQAFPPGCSDANEIRVTTSTDPAGRAVVEVRDTGSGIPPAVVGHIFEPFFTTKPVGVGTGLGLAISHNLVTAMGGEISVQTEVGAGTTFRVALPPSRSSEATVVRTNGHSKPVATQRASVLVVDDEPAVGSAICRVLAYHDVTFVTSAQEALDLLAAGRMFDVLLSDVMMPQMSGMELYRQIVGLYPKMASKVVFVTGGAFTPEASAFLDRVGNERIEKPFEPRSLRELIRRLVAPTPPPG